MKLAAVTTHTSTIIVIIANEWKNVIWKSRKLLKASQLWQAQTDSGNPGILDVFWGFASRFSCLNEICFFSLRVVCTGWPLLGNTGTSQLSQLPWSSYSRLCPAYSETWGAKQSMANMESFCKVHFLSLNNVNFSGWSLLFFCNRVQQLWRWGIWENWMMFYHKIELLWALLKFQFTSVYWDVLWLKGVGQLSSCINRNWSYQFQDWYITGNPAPGKNWLFEMFVIEKRGSRGGGVYIGLYSMEETCICTVFGCI